MRWQWIVMAAWLGSAGCAAGGASISDEPGGAGGEPESGAGGRRPTPGGSGGAGGIRPIDAPGLGGEGVDARALPADTAAAADAGEPADATTDVNTPDAAAPADGPPPVTPPPACQRRVNAGSLAELGNAIAAAQPGDCVVLADGSYTSSAAIHVARAGTAAAPIVITAASVGGATIAGSAGFNLDAPSAYVTIRGFRFTHAAPLVMGLGTSRCTITRNLFQLTGTSGDYLYVQGTDHEISFNRFQNKAYAGAMVQVDASGRDHGGTQRAHFHHNHWLKHGFTGANGGECLATWGGFTLAEFNLFEDCSGDPEIITVKASDGVYRYNTFRGSTRGQLSLRYTNRTTIQGNFFFGTKGGLRAYGKDNKVINNHFENNGGIGLYISNGQSDGSYIGIERMLVAHNTLVNDGVAARAGDLPPLTVTFANNLIRKDGGNFVAEGPGWQVKYEGNIFWGTAATGTVPAAGFRKVDPRLALDPDGVSRLGAGSAAIDAAVGSYGVTDDLDGQPRAGTPDVGADERSQAPVLRRPLGAGDVGPNAGS